MGFWSDIGDAISDGADAVGNAVEDVVNGVGDAVSDAVETVGNGISDGLNVFGSVLEKIPGVGRLLGGVVRWLGDIVSSGLTFVGATIKSVLNLAAGIVAGTVRVIGGIWSLDWSLIKKGLLGMAASVAGFILIFAGTFWAWVQSVIPLQWGKRRLTKQEEIILRRVYRRSVALYNVRIIEGFAGLYSLTSDPFTLGNVIYMKDHDPVAEPKLLVHECAHVWQYQHRGARYAADAVGAQWFIEDEYNWLREYNAGVRRWQDFNSEAEAEFLEDVYHEGHLTGHSSMHNGEFYKSDPVSMGVEFRNATLTAFARDSVAYVRGAFNWRPSGFFPGL